MHLIMILLACHQYCLIALAIVLYADMQSVAMHFKTEDKPSICGASNQQYLKRLSYNFVAHMNMPIDGSPIGKRTPSIGCNNKS
jgi:hypothetical protein